MGNAGGLPPSLRRPAQAAAAQKQPYRGRIGKPDGCGVPAQHLGARELLGHHVRRGFGGDAERLAPARLVHRRIPDRCSSCLEDDCIDQPQVRDGAKPAVLVDHCHWIADLAHPGGAGL